MSIGKPDYTAPSRGRREQSKTLRREQSPAERKLWRALRECLPLQKTHFRRQVAIGNFIADFCAQGPKLIIEVDGEQHGEDAARAHDSRRDQFLVEAGYRVLRFSTRDVNFEMSSVLDTIAAAVNARFLQAPHDPH